MALLVSACQTRTIEGHDTGEPLAAASTGNSTAAAVGTSGTSSGATGASASSASSGSSGSTGASSVGSGTGTTTGSAGTSGTTTGGCPNGQAFFRGTCVPDQVCGPGTVWDGDTCIALDCTDNRGDVCLTPDGGNGSCISGACIDLENDPGNCGSYGFQCPPSYLCDRGACVGGDAGPDPCFPPYHSVVVSPNHDVTLCLLATCTQATDNQLCGVSDPSSYDFADEFCCHGNCVTGDLDNCGGCGLSCGQGSVCAYQFRGCVAAADCASAATNAQCRLPTGTQGFCCGSACVDLESDSHNCGWCGAGVLADAGCDGGEPTVACQSDAECPVQTVCEFGRCNALGCPPGSDTNSCFLGGDAGYGTCCGGVCLHDTDPCGRLCNFCPEGTVCDGTACVTPADCRPDGGDLTTRCVTDAGTIGTCCGWECADLSKDPSNCQYCNEACPVGATCEDLTSGFPCSINCPDAPCPSGYECLGSQCISETCQGTGASCAADGGWGGCCGGECVVATPDGGGCSGCGSSCPAGEFCYEGGCVEANGGRGCTGADPACPSGSVCFDPGGACMPVVACPPEDYAPGAFCLVGPRNQNGNCCRGSCVNESSDPRNCGGCGVVCDSGICAGEFSGCLPDGPSADCLQTCALTSICVDGSCVGSLCTGESGFCLAEDGTVGECCDSACAHPRDDPQNCGSCGTVCPPGHACVGGRCQGSACSPALQRSFCDLDAGPNWACCGNDCTNLFTDPANCGYCGLVCLPGQSCDAGNCG